MDPRKEARGEETDHGVEEEAVTVLDVLGELDGAWVRVRSPKRGKSGEKRTLA